LQGCGEVSIDNPGLPFRLGALASGGHATMTLHLEVAFCVTDISITERGNSKTTPAMNGEHSASHRGLATD